jgi:hypothetical protein
VHHVKVIVLRHPQADAFIHHGFHVGGYDGQAKLAATEFNTCIAFRAAFHAALAWQQQDVVVIKNFHIPKLQKITFED